MKRVFFIIAVLVSGILTANAQMFVGGSMNFSSVGDKEVYGGSTPDDKTTTTSFSLSPKVGFYLSDDFVVGGRISLSTITNKFPDPTDPKKELKSGTSSWGIGGFARKQLLDWQSFGLHVEGSLGFGGSKSKYDGKETGSSTTLSLTALPVLTYSINEKLEIEATYDFFNLGFSSTTYKNPNNTDWKETKTSFGFNVNKHFNPVTGFSIGFVYKF